jgi:hypothetical protein
MADTLTTQSATLATVPASSVIATDDAGAAGHVQVVKLAISTDGSATPLTADNTDGLLVNLGTNNDVTVTGSVAVTNAGLTELAGAINASAQMDVNIAASGATVPVSNAGLTELAAAINASSQMDVNIAASGATVPVSNAGLTALNGAISGTEVQVDVLSMPSTTVTATNLDVRDLTSASDSVAVLQATASNLNATEVQATGSNLHTVVDSGTVTTVTTVTTATTLTGSSLAHDDADGATNPHKIGAKAVSSTEGVTLVAANDRTNLYADVDGVLVVKQSCTNDDVVSERVSNTDGASTAFTNFAAVASTHNCVSSISIFNSSASAVFIDFRDGTAGAVLFTMGAPAGGGSVISCGNQPYLFRTSQNTALAFDGSAAASTIYISVSGYQSKA